MGVQDGATGVFPVIAVFAVFAVARLAADEDGLDVALPVRVGPETENMLGVTRPEDVGLAARIGAGAIYVGPRDVTGPRVWSFPSLAAAAPFLLERIQV